VLVRGELTNKAPSRPYDSIALVEAKRRVFIRHQRDVDQHSLDPAVDAHHEREEAARVGACDQQEDACDHHEQVQD